MVTCGSREGKKRVLTAFPPFLPISLKDRMFLQFWAPTPTHILAENVGQDPALKGKFEGNDEEFSRAAGFDRETR